MQLQEEFVTDDIEEFVTDDINIKCKVSKWLQLANHKSGSLVSLRVWK